MALGDMGQQISADTERKELVKLGFSRQYNHKADEGSKHPDRDAQVQAYQHKSGSRPGQGTTRHLGRYQEEGTGRQL